MVDGRVDLAELKGEPAARPAIPADTADTATIKALQQEKEQLQSGIREHAEALVELQKAHAAAQEELKKLKGSRDGLAPDDAKRQLGDLTEQLSQAEAIIARLQSRQTVLVEQISSMRRQMEAAGIKPDVKPDAAPLEGKVLAVKGDNLLQISIGSDVGVKIGDIFDVHRPQQFGEKTVGQAQVIFVNADKAACRMLPDQKMSPATGDQVRAKMKQDAPQVGDP